MFRTQDFVDVIGQTSVNSLAEFLLKFAHVESSLHTLLEFCGKTTREEQRITADLKCFEKNSAVAQTQPQMAKEFIELVNYLIPMRNAIIHGILQSQIKTSNTKSAYTKLTSIPQGDVTYQLNHKDLILSLNESTLTNLNTKVSQLLTLGEKIFYAEINQT